MQEYNPISLLFRYLDSLKQEVDDKKWNIKGKGLFLEKTPDGIARLRIALKQLKISSNNAEEIRAILENVSIIFEEKQTDYQGWGKRDPETQDFYNKELKKLNTIKFLLNPVNDYSQYYQKAYENSQDYIKYINPSYLHRGALENIDSAKQILSSKLADLLSKKQFVEICYMHRKSEGFIKKIDVSNLYEAGLKDIDAAKLILSSRLLNLLSKKQFVEICYMHRKSEGFIKKIDVSNLYEAGLKDIDAAKLILSSRLLNLLSKKQFVEICYMHRKSEGFIKKIDVSNLYEAGLKDIDAAKLILSSRLSYLLSESLLLKIYDAHRENEDFKNFAGNIANISQNALLPNLYQKFLEEWAKLKEYQKSLSEIYNAQKTAIEKLNTQKADFNKKLSLKNIAKNIFEQSDILWSNANSQIGVFAKLIIAMFEQHGFKVDDLKNDTEAYSYFQSSERLKLALKTYKEKSVSPDIDQSALHKETAERLAKAHAEEGIDLRKVLQVQNVPEEGLPVRLRKIMFEHHPDKKLRGFSKKDQEQFHRAQDLLDLINQKNLTVYEKCYEKEKNRLEMEKNNNYRPRY